MNFSRSTIALKRSILAQKQKQNRDRCVEFSCVTRGKDNSKRQET